MAVVLEITPVTDLELLVKVKELNNYGENDFDDGKITSLIIDAKNYLLGAGVSEKLVNSQYAVTVIACYVDDISYNRPLRDYIGQRITQLRMM